MYFQKQRKLIVNNITRQHQWISPIIIKALIIYQKTLGKSVSLSIDLKLLNNRPCLEVNPLLEKFDANSLLTVPFSFLFLITLYRLLTGSNPLSAKEVVQAVIMICALAMFSFGGIIRHILRKNADFAAQCNALWQYNPTSKSENV